MFTIEPNTKYVVHKAGQSEGKKAYIRIREKDNSENNSKFVVKFFMDTLPEGAKDGCTVMIKKLTADFKASMMRHQYNGMWFEELAFNGVELEVVA